MGSVDPSSGIRPQASPREAGGGASGLASQWAQTSDPRGGQVLRYSRLVARAKRILPLVAALPVLVIVTWPYLSADFARITDSFPRFDVSQVADLRMVNPRYVGTDHDNHPFTVTAATALQNNSNDDLMALEKPKALFRLSSGAAVTIAGDTGLYQAQAHFLDLAGNVTVTHEKGYVFKTRSARVDLDNDSAEGNDPVTGFGPSSSISSDGFRALHNGQSVIFTGHAQLDMTPAGSDRP